MDLKDDLIKVGDEHPDLQDDIRPILDRLTGKQAQLNEDTEAEVRGILDEKEDRLDTMRDLLGKDEFNEDAEDEVLGLLEADTNANDTIKDLLGIGG